MRSSVSSIRHGKSCARRESRPIRIRASARTIQRLGKKPREQLLLTVNDRTKLPWTKDAFNKQFRNVAEKAGLTGYVFRQIRNSAAIFALQADLNDGEFQQRFGWTKDDVREMRDLYTDKNQQIIDRGADKLAEYEKSGQWKS